MPTVRELAARGLATELKPNVYRVSAEGQKILSDAMRRNGQRARAWREEHR